MRSRLNALYRASHALACTCLALIAALVVVQVLMRLLDVSLKAVGQSPIGLIIPSLTEFGAFLLVGATALALGPALKSGSHVRVSLLIESVPKGARRTLNVLVLLLAIALIGFASYHLVDLAVDAFIFHERSYGLIAFPLWIPQAFMALGFIIFTIALIDEFLLTLRTGTPGFEAAKADDLAAGAE